MNIALTRRELIASGAAFAAVPAWASGTRQLQGEDYRINAFFKSVFDREVARDPFLQSALGLSSGRDKWPDVSEEYAAETARLLHVDLKQLRTFNTTDLTSDSLLSYCVFEYERENALIMHRWRNNRYPVCQMRGPQRTVPQTLINNHAIADRNDAEAYISRLRGVKPYLSAVVDGLERQAGMGVLPPAFSYPLVIGNCRNLIRGAPFSGDGDSPILADFKSKVARLDLSDAIRLGLVTEAQLAMREGFGPGFRLLIDWLMAAQARMTRNDAVWSLPDGDAYYLARLALETTLPLTPEQVHRTGLEEVARIHDAMHKIMDRVGFSGSLADFFTFVQTEPQFYYPDTAAGKAAYLKAMRDRIAAVEARLGEVMMRVPRAKLVVKPVEPWLEQSAGTAGYFTPAPDGSRPGILYVNTVDMRNLPIYELSALSFHEGLPGHHLENAISQELTDLPAFRRHGGYTSYSEGWALYAEQLPYAMGLYDDPYQEFGQLSLELLRAGRLVVDTGLHSLRWTREMAVEWLDRHTPSNHADNIAAIQRYIVTPGQATAYEIGKLKMMELRNRAQTKLGAAYDLRRFNDALLGSGPLPLPLLEKNIDGWIADERKLG